MKKRELIRRMAIDIRRIDATLMELQEKVQALEEATEPLPGTLQHAAWNHNHGQGVAHQPDMANLAEFEKRMSDVAAQERMEMPVPPVNTARFPWEPHERSLYTIE